MGRWGQERGSKSGKVGQGQMLLEKGISDERNLNPESGFSMV
jgi:hypothetical protein